MVELLIGPLGGPGNNSRNGTQNVFDAPELLEEELPLEELELPLEELLPEELELLLEELLPDELLDPEELELVLDELLAPGEPELLLDELLLEAAPLDELVDPEELELVLDELVPPDEPELLLEELPLDEEFVSPELEELPPPQAVSATLTNATHTGSANPINLRFTRKSIPWFTSIRRAPSLMAEVRQRIS